MQNVPDEGTRLVTGYESEKQVPPPILPVPFAFIAYFYCPQSCCDLPFSKFSSCTDLGTPYRHTQLHQLELL